MAIKQRYSHVFEGFAGAVAQSRVAALRADPAVAAVYLDAPINVAEQRVPSGVQRVQADTYNRIHTRTVAVPGDIAVVDTGVSRHPDLNVYRNVDCASNKGCSTRRSAEDEYGHGTHVAGIAAARDNNVGVVGVAPGARIWNVRVFDAYGYGQFSWLIAALDWVAARADRIEVINASLAGSDPEEPVEAAVAGAAKRGLVVVAAAGNDSADAGSTLPASAPDAIAVSAFIDTDGRPGGRGPGCETDPGVFSRDDTFLSWSNYGPVVDIAAPGACVLSTVPTGGYARVSGTSMAAPHVAGAALLWIDKTHLRAGPKRAARVRAALSGPWSVPQRSQCGFRGGKSSEPALMLRGCHR
jgi:subtilisin family serine protease